jgi:hypothetical protein
VPQAQPDEGREPTRLLGARHRQRCVRNGSDAAARVACLAAAGGRWGSSGG